MTEEQPEEKKEQPKPVNFKQNIELLMAAYQGSKEIIRYEALEKNYPSDLRLHMGPGKQPIGSPTLVGYIAKAEGIIVKKHMADIIAKASSMIEQDIDEIRELLK